MIEAGKIRGDLPGCITKPVTACGAALITTEISTAFADIPGTEGTVCPDIFAGAAIALSGDAPTGRLFPYDDVVAAHAGKLAFPDRDKMIDALVMPQLRLLMEFDGRDGTDYVESLAAYLNSGRNVATAATMLHVHKNSVYYRLQRMNELAGIDVANERTCFLLQFSLALMGMGPTAAD